MSGGRMLCRPSGLPPHGRSASVADIFGVALRAAGFVVLAGLLTACTGGARPVGDFGRAAPSVTHDTAMPAVGGWLARQRKEPYSDFNQTDQETEMHNRVWRFLIAAHAKDWFYDTAVEWQRTRILPEVDRNFSVDRYYYWLKSTQYESSRVRYSTVGRHIAADLDTVPGTFKSICEVVEVDRQRAIAVSSLSGLGPDEARNVVNRKAENDIHIAWFVRALNYRYQSYNYALDHLLVETPHEQSLAVDEALRRMSGFVDRANRRDFCGDGGAAGRRSTVVIPSRYETQVIDREIVLPK